MRGAMKQQPCGANARTEGWFFRLKRPSTPLSRRHAGRPHVNFSSSVIEFIALRDRGGECWFSVPNTKQVKGAGACEEEELK